MERVKSALASFVPSLTLVACVAVLPAQAGDVRTWSEPLLPSTGFNSDCDTAIFVIPAPLEPDAHFDFIGLYDPGAPADGPDRDAIALTPDDCVDSLDREIATTSNPDFRAANGFPAPDTRLQNLRSNEVPKAAEPDGVRAFLPPEGATPPPFPPTQSLPADPLTLGEFRDIAGEMNLRCFDDGTARARIRVSGYRPNSLLTVWGIWLATPPGAPGPAIVPLPFGGTPNVMPIGPDGRGRFIRDLGYCPKDVLANGDQLLVLDLAEHWDGAVYGAIPDVPFGSETFVTEDGSTFTSAIGAGIVTVNRGVINVTLER